MRVRIDTDTRLFVDIEGPTFVPSGDTLVEAPTIITLHGGPGVDHVFLRGAFGPVAEHARLVHFDQRGHGRSDHSSAEHWNLATWADDVVRLCDALGIVRPIVYGGSFGATVALAYATRHPSHAAGVVLDGPGARFVHEWTVEGFRRAGGDAAADVADRFWQDPRNGDFGEYGQVCVPVHARKPAQYGFSGAGSAPCGADLAMHWAAGEWHTFDLRPGLAGIEFPVLIFSGGYDPIVPAEAAREVAAGIPDARLHEFPEAGHGLLREEPEQAHQLIMDFLQEVAPTTAGGPATST